MFSVYVVRAQHGSERRYIGKTNDLRRRLRQHNGVICGGARATRGRAWEYELVIDGFACDSHAMQAEWRLKHERRKLRGAPRAQPWCWLGALCRSRFSAGEGWTSNSPPPEQQALVVRTNVARAPPDGWPAHWGWTELRSPDDSQDPSSPIHTADSAARD